MLWQERNRKFSLNKLQCDESSSKLGAIGESFDPGRKQGENSDEKQNSHLKPDWPTRFGLVIDRYYRPIFAFFMCIGIGRCGLLCSTIRHYLQTGVHRQLRVAGDAARNGRAEILWCKLREQKYYRLPNRLKEIGSPYQSSAKADERKIGIGIGPQKSILVDP